MKSLVLLASMIALCSCTTTRSVTDVSDLISDGKLYYEMGRLAEAETALKAALVQVPDNKPARYNLDLVEEARSQRGHKAAPDSPLRYVPLAPFRDRANVKS